jgi:hypothetical protein
VVVAGLVVAVGAAEPASAATSCSSPVGAGQIRVVVVVDPGGAPQATCLIVADGTRGAEVLAQRAALLGRAQPRYAGSGLLCGLDGFPASGCPTNSGGAFDYWAYFKGTGGGWSYGTDNPFQWRMHDGDVMGWRWNEGASEAGAQPPGMGSGGLFPPLVVPPPPPPVTQPPPSGGSTSGGTGGAAPGSGGGPATTAPASEGSTAATDPTAPDAEDPAAAADDPTVPATQDDLDGAEELAAEPASSSSSEVGRWVGVLVVAVVIGGLAVGAIVMSRSRARP